MNEPIDPRRGLPSASSLERLANCPPSHKLCSLLPPEERDTDSEVAASGTRIHNVLAGLADYGTLSSAEQETCDMCEQQAKAAVIEWGCDDPDAQTYVEQRLGLTVLGNVIDVTDETTADLVFTGQADYVCIQDNRAICLDYKTGRGETATAVNNAQLCGLAVLVAKRYKVDSVRVVIVAPWQGKPTKADYTGKALELATRWLFETLHIAADSLPEQAKAGDWCTYCAFGMSGRCETANAAAHREIEVVEPMTLAGMDPETQRAALFARAMELSPQRHIAAYLGLALVKRYIRAIEGSFEARVEAGQIPGWTIESKPGNREITDAQKAFDALIPLGLTGEDMLEAASVAIGPLEEAVRRRSGIKSQTEKRTVYNLTAKEAKERLNAALEAAGAIERKADKRVPVVVGLENTNAVPTAGGAHYSEII
jgi:hypothetical protein